MRVWVVQDGEPLPGIDGDTRPWRAAMLCSALAAAGHEVVWWSSTFNHVTKKHRFDGPRTVAFQPGGTMRLLHGPGYPNNRSPRRWLHHRAMAAAFGAESRAWPRPDLVFASLPTLELAERAVVYGNEHGVPVVVDVRDPWPDVYLTMIPASLRPLARLALTTETRRAKRILTGASAITAVSRQYLTWGLQRAHRGPGEWDAVFALGYPDDTQTQLSHLADRATALCQRFAIRADAFVATFVGSFGASCDLETVIRAARMLMADQPAGIQVVLAGDGDQGARLRDLARGVGNVVFTGWLERPDVTALLSVSDAGLAPYAATAVQSLPNKPFEYMAAGLPIVSSLPGEMGDLIRDTNTGLQYRAGDDATLTRHLLWMAAHPEEVQTMGKRARALFRERFREGAIYPSLVSHLERVARTD